MKISGNFFKAALIFTGLFFITSLFGATVTWNGVAGDGLWSSATNWSSNATPTSTDNVVIPKTFTVTINGNAGKINQITVQGKLIIAATGMLNVEQTVSLDPLVDVAAGEIVNEGSLTIKQTIVSNTNQALKFSNGTDAGDAKFTNTGSLLVDLTARPAASGVACISFSQSTTGRTARFTFGGNMTFNLPAQARLFEITSGYTVMDGTYIFGSTSDYKNWRFIQLTQGNLTLASTANITLYSGYNLAYAGTIASSNSKDITFTNNGILVLHGGPAVAGYGIYMNPQNANNTCTFTNSGNLTIDENFPLGALYMGGSSAVVSNVFNNQSGATLTLSNTNTTAGAVMANATSTITNIFNNAGTMSLNSASARNIYFGGSNSTFNNTGTVNVTKAITGNSTTTACVFNNNTGGVFNFNVSDNAQPAISNANKITFNNNGGTVAGRGVFSAGTFVPSTGILSPGGNTGTGIFTFTDASLALTGKCVMNINGTNTAGTDYDQINSTGTLDIYGCTLDARIGSGYTPAASDNVTLISAVSRAGNFFSFTAPTIWSVFYTTTSAILSYGEPGEVKRNGIKIMLKLDDLQVLNGVCPSIATMDYLKQKQVKAGLGAIANRFDATAPSTLNSYLSAVNSEGDKLFEIWHHGLDHVDPEFKGTGYEYQKSHFDQATQLIKNLLGVQMHSFGTPFNASDAATNTVISEDPNYKAFMFPSIPAPASSGIVNLTKRVDMENGVGNPEYAFFVTNYNTYKTTYDYMVLQGHPNQWTSAKLDQFKLIVEYLIAQGCEFVLPYDYYLSLTLSAPTNLSASVVSTSEINLSWSDNTNSEYNYKIERSGDGTNWSLIATVPENTTSYSDKAIPVSVNSFYYRVYASCGIKSGYSNVVKSADLLPSIMTSAYPTDDVYLTKSTTGATGNEIRGMGTTLNCYRNPASDIMWWSIPYLKFDLRNINLFDRVKLRLYGTVNEAHGFDLYTTSLTGWAEDALTFNNVTEQTGTVSTTPVASLDVIGNPTAQYYDWDVTTAVSAAIQRGETFISFKLQDRYAVKDAFNAGIIVQFHSKENASGKKPELQVAEKNIEPFKLSELKVGGTLVDDFAPTQTRYFVTLPYNATITPAVTALAANPLCTVRITNATNLAGTLSQRTALVTAKIGADSVVYKVTFEFSANPGDASITSLKIDNDGIENFNKDTYQYRTYLPYTTTQKPVISVATFDPFATVTVTQATNLTGTVQERTAVVTIVSQNGQNTKTYAVEFEVLPKLDIFLAIGQSNMAGRGTMTANDLAPIENVYILTPAANMEIASNPLNKYSSVRKELSMQQMSPSCSFVKTIRDQTQHPIGLMQNARGGSAIESWLKGSSDRLYEEALRRALEIQKFGEIKGIIWHQGESNSGDPAGYKIKLTKMVSDFRTDLGIPNLFFIAGEIAQWCSGVAAFNTMIRTITTFVPNSEWVSSDGLTPLIDTSDPHFDAASVKILGERYAAKMLSNVYNLSAAPKTKEANVSLAELKTSKGQLRIETLVDNLTLNIFDVSGRCVTAEKISHADSHTFRLSTGVYFIQLANTNGSQVTKVVL